MACSINPTAQEIGSDRWLSMDWEPGQAHSAGADHGTGQRVAFLDDEWPLPTSWDDVGRTWFECIRLTSRDAMRTDAAGCERSRREPCTLPKLLRRSFCKGFSRILEGLPW